MEKIGKINKFDLFEKSRRDYEFISIYMFIIHTLFKNNIWIESFFNQDIWKPKGCLFYV